MATTRVEGEFSLVYLVLNTTTSLTTQDEQVACFELDLMARIAGLTLEHRWAGWGRSPFTGDSPSHVSVWS